MRKALFVLLLTALFFIVAPAHAQQGNTTTIIFAGVPTGTCGSLTYAINNSNGDLYDCFVGSWNKVSGGGGGASNCPGAGGTANALLKDSGTQGTCTDSLASDNGTTFGYTGTGGVNAAQYSTTGLHAGYFQCGPGSSDSAPPSLVSANFQLVCPASITNYQMLVPAASATGFLLGTDTTNSNQLSFVGFSGTGNVALVTSPTLVTPALGTPASGVLTNTTGYLWNALANPSGNLALSMGTQTSIFSGTAATSQFFAWKNTTPAVVGTSQGSPVLSTCGRAFHGSADVEDCMTFSELPGNGNDAAIAFTIGHTGTSTGAVTVHIPSALESDNSGGNLSLYNAGNGNVNLGTNSGFSVGYQGNLIDYFGRALVRNGIPAELYNSDLTTQSAAITATTIHSAPYTGVFNVCWSADITTASDISSVLGGTNGFQVIYTSPTDSVVKTTNPTTPIISSGNTTGTSLGGCTSVYAKTGTNIQYAFGYTNSDTSIPMVYELHITVEGL